MQKLNNFIYMIAAAIVSNLVYTINGISAYAATCTYTHNSYFTDRRGQGNNLSSCSSSCRQMWNGMPYVQSWRASYNSTNRSCTCIVTGRYTATGTWQYAAYGACGRRNECAITYRTCDTCANRSTVRTGDVICNSDNIPGYAGYMSVSSKYVNASEPYWIYSTMCNCCPCTGTAGMGESCMGSQNGAGPYMLVYSDPYAQSIKGCYIQGTGGFDKTGAFEYPQGNECHWSDTLLPSGPSIPVAP